MKESEARDCTGTNGVRPVLDRLCLTPAEKKRFDINLKNLEDRVRSKIKIIKRREV